MKLVSSYIRSGRLSRALAWTSGKTQILITAVLLSVSLFPSIPAHAIEVGMKANIQFAFLLGGKVLSGDV